MTADFVSVRGQEMQCGVNMSMYLGGTGQKKHFWSMTLSNLVFLISFLTVILTGHGSKVFLLSGATQEHAYVNATSLPPVVSGTNFVF